MQELQRGDPQRVGPYRLVGRLGSGGMGRVFVGRSAGGRLVAVKVIRDDLAADPEFRMRFGREVAAARWVGGLFTALVVDADVESPTPWLATVYVAGPSLADAVSKCGPLPPESVLSLAAGLAEGLGEIHAVGLVHRDLKPSNVLLADDGPRVIDFGISRAAEASVLTRTGLVIGSPGFMSPEQAEGGEVGPASDVFSLGAVLVFAATGASPFGTGSTAALVYRVVHSPPGLDDVPPQVRPVAGRCLAKDPGQRPTPAELLAEFGDVDLAAAWLPTRVLDGFAQHAPPALASIDSSPRHVPTEHVGQPSLLTAASDAPHTVTAAPRYQLGEPPTAQPPPAVKAARPQAAEPQAPPASITDQAQIPLVEGVLPAEDLREILARTLSGLRSMWRDFHVRYGLCLVGLAIGVGFTVPAVFYLFLDGDAGSPRAYGIVHSFIASFGYVVALIMFGLAQRSRRRNSSPRPRGSHQ